jgi:hypothetical protein
MNMISGTLFTKLTATGNPSTACDFHLGVLMRSIFKTIGLLISLFIAAAAFGQSNTVVSVNSTGSATSNGVSLGPVTSADGRFVAFQSSATDLVAGTDSNLGDDIFVRDLQTNTTKLVSINSAGTAPGNKTSSAPVISADGRFVAFLSLATDLVATTDNNNSADVFVRDLQTNTTKLVSVNNSASATGNGSCGNPVISLDGRFVTFSSNAPDLGAIIDSNNVEDIFVRDLQTNTTTLVSVNSTGTAPGNNSSVNPVISADGRFVAFESSATTLVTATDNNGVTDVFVRDRQSNTTKLVSLNSASNAAGNNQSQLPAISADGRFIAFLSFATDLVAVPDNNNDSDTFVRDLQANTTSLISVNNAGNGAGNMGSGPPIISPDGRFVSFVSFATDLVVMNDNNTATDVFVRDRQTNTTKLISVNSSATATGNGGSGAMVMSADGRFVAFSSFATDLVATTDNNTNIDVFVRDLQANTTKLASVNSAGTATGNNFSVGPALSADGRTLAFVSIATNLVTTPEGNSNRDVFVFAPLRSATTSVQLSSSSSTVSEASGSVTVTVTRSGDTSAASTVDYSTSDGGATQSQDYTVANGTLSFAPGETSKTFNVLIIDDAYVEASEVINISLSNATGGFLGSPISSTITITDNDSAGTPAYAKRFFANLSGANSVGKGIGLVLLSPTETSGSVGLAFRNLTSGETGAHIHSGSVVSGGPIIFNLPLTNPVTNFAISPTVQQVADLKAGQQYMDIHTVNFGIGEIGGQLLWNPTLEENFFVRQQYLDFLSREPDTNGFNFWQNQVSSCAADADCFHQRTISTSNAFFFEPEFQQTAGFVFRAYRAAYGNTQPFPNPDNSNTTEGNKLINYSAFIADRARVVGGADLATSQLAFANLFVTRPEFISHYASGLTGAQFVDALLARIQSDDGVDLTSQRQALIDQFNNAGGGNAGRAQVLYRLADDNAQNPINNQAFINAEYNRQFALTLYFGYLRRNPDIGGFLFWQSQINTAPIRDVPKQNALVCSFITSGEYQMRFGSGVPRSNLECQ